MTYADFEHCAVKVAIEMIAGKWKPMILFYLMPGEMRFTALWRAIPRVSKKVLLEQLHQLEADRLVIRHEHLKYPPEVGYSLSAKGAALLPVLQTIEQWAAIHLSDVVTMPHRVENAQVS